MRATSAAEATPASTTTTTVRARAAPVPVRPIATTPIRRSIPNAAEICNGKDDDCDGQIDEGNVCGGGNPCVVGQSCTTGLPGQCAAGTSACPNGMNGAMVCVQNVQPSAETCNGFDDDCDGVVDDNCNGGAVKMCTVQFDWTFDSNAQYQPVSSVIGGVFAGWDPPSGAPQSHWMPSGAAATNANIQANAACVLTHVATNTWSCSLQVENGTPSLLFVMGIQNPASLTGMTWSYDSGSWPGGGYGSFIGTKTVHVNGIVQTPTLVDNFDGTPNTSNGLLSTISCP